MVSGECSDVGLTARPPTTHHSPLNGCLMSNDAKLGLVLGVAIVLLIALVFFGNDALEARMPTDPTQATTVLNENQPSHRSPATHIAPALP